MAKKTAQTTRFIEVKFDQGLLKIELEETACRLIEQVVQASADEWARDIVFQILAKIKRGRRLIVDRLVEEARRSGKPLPKGTEDEIVARCLAATADDG